MGILILKSKELEKCRNSLDYLHEGIIDLQATLESSNWGAPVEDTEEIRKTLSELSNMGFIFLRKLDKYIDWQKRDEENKKE